jgi:hypothetical protein
VHQRRLAYASTTCSSRGKDLSDVEQQVYKVKVDEELHARAEQLPSRLYNRLY